ncbi:MAG: hypothetical protein OHK0022_27800 [Roseiflexaceae bacterium]
MTTDEQPITPPRQYRYESVGADHPRVQSLREDAEGALDAQFARVTIYDEAGIKAEPESAFAIYVPSAGRGGIVWGGDPTWGDARDLEEMIETWLNNPEEWERRN